MKNSLPLVHSVTLLQNVHYIDYNIVDRYLFSEIKLYVEYSKISDTNILKHNNKCGINDKLVNI